MFRETSSRARAFALVGALAMLTVASPVAADTPDRTSETSTTLACNLTTTDGSLVRLVAFTSSTGASSGFLTFTPDGAPAPTLIDLGVLVSVDAGGNLVASYQVYEAGDLGLSEDTEPVFVGVAELVASLSPTGEVTETVERSQVGNGRFVQVEAVQELAVTSGTIDVPTVGISSLTASAAACEAFRETAERFETMPNVDISEGQLIQLHCFVETQNGFVIVVGQAGANETAIGYVVVDGFDSYFGIDTDAELTRLGAASSAALPNDADPSVVATADLSARFSVIDRLKGRSETEDGWATETSYLLSVAGSLSIDGPGLSLDLSLDGCSADAQIGMSQSH